MGPSRRARRGGRYTSAQLQCKTVPLAENVNELLLDDPWVVEDDVVTAAELLEQWREASRAAELAERLANLASETAERADQGAIAAEEIARMAERAAKAADRAATSGRRAAERAAAFARDNRTGRLADADHGVLSTKRKRLWPGPGTTRRRG